jgi:AAA domain/Bifunctional DNA primase/polymerase, N-terminal
MAVPTRENLLDSYGRFYGEERFAVAFTAGTSGENAKRVVTRGWDQTKPLSTPDYAAGLIANRGQSANLAIVLRPSNLIVIECDSEDDLVRIEALGLPTTLTVRSSAPYKRHFYFRPAETLEAVPFVSFRFESGKLTADSGRYFLAPPSLHPSGVMYDFLPGLGPHETDIVELAEEVYRDLCDRAREESAEQRERIAVDPEAKIFAGQRRDLIFRYACMLRRWGRPYEAILDECQRFNLERCEPPVDRDLVVVQVKGAMKKEGDQELAGIVLDQLPAVRIATLDEFVSVDEPGAEAIVGSPDSALVPANGDVMLYGDGGVGKTTLAVDLGFHLAAGTPWLGIEIARPVGVLVIENEGPRALFRKKLARRAEAWRGKPVGDRFHVLEQPWAAFTFGSESWRERLAEIVQTYDVGVVFVGPLVASGMEAAGTLQEVRAFISLVDDVRLLANRDLAVFLVHHENKGGKVSGAWEGAGDTLLHARQQGHGQLRLYVQKARWASELHATALQLRWADGDSFERDETQPSHPDEVYEAVEAYVLGHGGITWGEVRDAVRKSETISTSNEELGKQRDRLLDERAIRNTSTRSDRYELWHRDDPERPVEATLDLLSGVPDSRADSHLSETPDSRGDSRPLEGEEEEAVVRPRDPYRGSGDRTDDSLLHPPNPLLGDGR